MQTPEDFTNALAQSSEQVAEIDTDFLLELAEIEVESMGWIPLEERAYLHVGGDAGVVEIVGLADAGMADSDVLWIV
jgi:hypothetical protein